MLEGDKENYLKKKIRESFKHTLKGLGNLMKRDLSFEYFFLDRI